MVTEKEIETVAKMMKIETDNHKEYVDKVHAMIDYFDILDSAGIESDELNMAEIPISSLREDKHVPFDGNLLKCVNHYRKHYIKAPKLS